MSDPGARVPRWEAFLARPREVTCLWHLEQASAFRHLALVTGSASALVYGCLEARLMVERYIFEAGVLIRGATFSEQELKKALAQKGLNTFLNQFVGDWRKYFVFTGLIASLHDHPDLSSEVPNIAVMQDFITRLSRYCHWIADPTVTIDDPKREWFTTGIAALSEAVTLIRRSPHSAMQVDTMAPEVRTLWGAFRDDRVDEASARRQLELMNASPRSAAP